MIGEIACQHRDAAGAGQLCRLPLSILVMPYMPPRNVEIAELMDRQKELFTAACDASQGTVIPASFLEMCAYCEQKAVYRSTDDERPASVRQALETHAAVERVSRGDATEPFSVADAWEAVAAGGFKAFRNLPLVHYHESEDTYIIARAHRIAFMDGVPLYVVRRRITASWVHQVFENEFVYPWLCCRILHAHGFPGTANGLRYALVKAHPDVHEQIIAGAERQFALRQLPAPWDASPNVLNTEEPLHGDVACYPARYDPDQFKARIRTWRRIYRGDKLPRGTDEAGRCRHCEYRKPCPKAVDTELTHEQ